MIDYDLRRCMAAWRDIEYNLDHLTRVVNAKNAEKWITDEDIQALETVSIMLESALGLVRARFSNVLAALAVGAKNEQVHEG